MLCFKGGRVEDRLKDGISLQEGLRWCSIVWCHRKVVISGCQRNFTAMSSTGELTE